MKRAEEKSLKLINRAQRSQRPSPRPMLLLSAVTYAPVRLHNPSARWCPFHPARQLGPDPSDLPLKRGFFQAPAGSSLSPPFSNIPFTPEITLFISRIIVSS
ncbi:hypothetical protein Q8A67_011987 [Cirrhinus molitorella]|uniref:Uncharacterized protein n=1 Tax=Cirrhinus molitorella TaxID=172907 RepID=A0AA88PNR3_9TELE|nr:hypothetical protein Q8A67_011987 [Cirrhinus molitorella]